MLVMESACVPSPDAVDVLRIDERPGPDEVLDYREMVMLTCQPKAPNMEDDEPPKKT